MPKPRITMVAIARDEESFIEEWLVYHRLLGVDRFVIYDDDPAVPLRRLLQSWGEYVEVIPWHNASTCLPGRNRQTKAYWHWLTESDPTCDWVGFIDIDEFVRLARHATLQEYLGSFAEASAVSLQWHVFGHNGHYIDPPGLVIESLTRRMSSPSRQFKSFTRPEAIESINSAHSCVLKAGCRHVDGNGRPFGGAPYEGITATANINHYQCRSFSRWMQRVGRGDVAIDPASLATAADPWRIDAVACLRHFVETVALDKNECVDTSMLPYAKEVARCLALAREPLGLPSRTLELAGVASGLGVTPARLVPNLEAALVGIGAARLHEGARNFTRAVATGHAGE